MCVGNSFEGSRGEKCTTTMWFLFSFYSLSDFSLAFFLNSLSISHFHLKLGGKVALKNVAQSAEWLWQCKYNIVQTIRYATSCKIEVKMHTQKKKNEKKKRPREALDFENSEQQLYLVEAQRIHK